MIYFTSDQHFFEKKVINLNERPFEESSEMNEAIINNWNDVVNDDDDVYILGDVTIKGGKITHETLSKLKGKKYLIRGNHDNFIKNTDFDDIFIWIKDYAEVEYKQHWFILSHYPFLEWNRFFNGSFHVHGHQHNKKSYNIECRENNIKRYDVGVDSNDFTPISAEEIVEFFTGIDYLPRKNGERRIMDGKNRSQIKKGCKVEIVLKEDQRTGKLTEGIVADILTNSRVHNRGIKVRLEDGQIGRVQKVFDMV